MEVLKQALAIVRDIALILLATVLITMIIMIAVRMNDWHP